MLYYDITMQKYPEGFCLWISEPVMLYVDWKLLGVFTSADGMKKKSIQNSQ